MKKSKRLDGKKKLITLTSRMEADMRSFCRDKGVESKSELVRHAIAQYIYADYADETLKLQGLKRLREQLAELRDMADITFSYIRLMHVSTLAYHPAIDPAFADAAFSSATERHAKFFEAFQENLKNNPPFFERLLHKYYPGDADEQG
jgi:hypothetical protein